MAVASTNSTSPPVPVTARPGGDAGGRGPEGRLLEELLASERLADCLEIDFDRRYRPGDLGRRTISLRLSLMVGPWLVGVGRIGSVLSHLAIG